MNHKTGDINHIPVQSHELRSLLLASPKDMESDTRTLVSSGHIVIRIGNPMSTVNMALLIILTAAHMDHEPF